MITTSTIAITTIAVVPPKFAAGVGAEDGVACANASDESAKTVMRARAWNTVNLTATDHLMM
jgi:hypothetical protein